MKTYSTKVQHLMTKHNILSIPNIGSMTYVDVESALKYMKATPHDRMSNNCSINHAPIRIIPKENCRIRSYQKHVVDSIVQNRTIRPTLVIMPCGSGKTFTALCTMATNQRRTLIITNFKVVAHQWKRELLKNFQVDSKIECISDDSFLFDYTNPPGITIVTYDALSSIGCVKSRNLVYGILMTDFSCILLDEAHKAVAPSYFSIISRLSGVFVAFTATPVREDSDMKLLHQLIEHEIEIPAENLIRDGYLSRIVCSTVIVPTDPRLYCKSLSYNNQIACAVVNPNKIKYLHQLLDTMVREQDKILIFCDDIWSLKYVHNQLKYSAIGPICMESTLSERERAITDFLEDDGKYKILTISRTGDEGIDVPSATKLIQICTPWGSRRQHAQRVGRLQRPSNNMRTCCEAITIVSDNTLEIEFSKRRDEYLSEMGYQIHESNVYVESEDDISKILRKVQSRKQPEEKEKAKKTKKSTLFKKMRIRMNSHKH